MNTDQNQRPPPVGARQLDVLQRLIAEKRGGDVERSGTARLLERGTPRCARKLGEEAVELVVAALSESRREVILESADLLYHWLVLMESLGIDAQEVYDELARRRGEKKVNDAQQGA